MEKALLWKQLAESGGGAAAAAAAAAVGDASSSSSSSSSSSGSAAGAADSAEAADQPSERTQSELGKRTPAQAQLDEDAIDIDDV